MLLAYRWNRHHAGWERAQERHERWIPQIRSC